MRAPSSDYWNGARPLIDAIARNRDDLQSWSVFADWLSERGDVRGALIMEDLAAAPSARLKLRLRHGTEHAAAIFGPFVEARLPRAIVRGFIDTLTTTPQVSGGELASLAAHSSTTFLRELNVRTLRARQRGLQALLARPVEELRLPREGCDAFIEALPPQGTVSALRLIDESSADLQRAFPQLRRLYVHNAGGWRDAPAS